MNEEINDVKIVKEQYVQVAESRIKYTIKEYLKGQPFSRILSGSFSCLISFLTAFASYSSNNNAWKWIFLSLAILSALVFSVFGIISLARMKVGRGTERWFLREIKNENSERYVVPIDGKKVKKTIFVIVNATLVLGVPILVLLLVLGNNGWDISNKSWSIIFWVFWSFGALCSLVFGSYINSLLAYIIFGYESELPSINVD